MHSKLCKTRIFSKLLAFIFLSIILDLGCTSKEVISNNKIFEFHSGGAYHPNGLGEWIIKVDYSGNLSISKNIRGKVKDYGTYVLSENEKLEFWEDASDLKIGTIAPLNRKGYPDEVEYTFLLTDSSGTKSVKIWINDARENEKIMTLVDLIAGLIEKYAKEVPSLK